MKGCVTSGKLRSKSMEKKKKIWKVGVSSEKRRTLQNAQIAKFSKRFKTQSVSWKATENQIFSFFLQTPDRPGAQWASRNARIFSFVEEFWSNITVTQLLGSIESFDFPWKIYIFTFNLKTF